MSESYSSEDIDRPQRDLSSISRRWNGEIASAQKAQRKFVERGQRIEKIYNAQKQNQSTSESRRGKFNILWSNVQTTMPAVYLQTPKVQIKRRYRDREPVARFASMLLERVVQTSCELYDFDNMMKQVVRDRLLPGRGTCWVVYEPTFQGMELAYERVSALYVPWKDLLHSPSRNWDELRWIGRRFYKTRSEARDWLKERGGDPGLADKLRLDCGPDGGGEHDFSRREESAKDPRSQASIYEIWDKKEQQIFYVAPNSGETSVILIEQPQIQFEGFFPTPRFLLATTTSESLVPTADYDMYESQAAEMDDLTRRISVLQKALKVTGLYDGSWAEVGNFLQGQENRMIAVEGWAMLQEGGGARGKIEWFPVEVVIEVLMKLYEARELAKQALYEISGISDIQRGATDPNETLGAQRIKAQWGTLRVRDTQKDVQRFARDGLRLKTEVVSEIFQFETILEMAGFSPELLAQYMPAGVEPQAFLKATEELIRGPMRNFKIDVESDSTIEPDEERERAGRLETLDAIGNFIQKGAPLVQQGPEGAKLAGEMIMFGVRSFRNADALEESVQQAAEAAGRAAAQPKSDPEAIKAQTEQAKMQIQERESQANQAIEQQRIQAENQRAAADVEAQRMQIERDNQMTARENAVALAELRIKEREHALQVAEFQFERQKWNDEVALKQRDQAIAARKIEVDERQAAEAARSRADGE